MASADKTMRRRRARSGDAEGRLRRQSLPRSRRNRGGFRLILAAALFAAAGVMVFPWCLSAAVTGRQIDAALTYSGTAAEGETDSRNAEIMEAALAYNEGIAENQRTEPFRYRGESAGDPVYEASLNTGGIMCLLEVPAISLTVPVIHGTKSEGLETAAGHFYGTSLPCGGVSSHAGIAAHSGLPDARLFTDLEDLREGDCFYIHILNETHVYRVDAIRVVEPKEADRYMQVAEGRDLITLYTCTPYGLNTHRLLVRGERDPAAEADLEDSVSERHRARLASAEARLRRKAWLCFAELALFSAGLVAASYAAALCLSKKRSLAGL